MICLQPLTCVRYFLIICKRWFRFFKRFVKSVTQLIFGCICIVCYVNSNVWIQGSSLYASVGSLDLVICIEILFPCLWSVKSFVLISDLLSIGCTFKEKLCPEISQIARILFLQTDFMLNTTNLVKHWISPNISRLSEKCHRHMSGAFVNVVDR